MSDEPTLEEIQRVREHECRMRSHTFTETTAIGFDGPTRVICTNCGRTWRVVEYEEHLGRRFAVSEAHEADPFGQDQPAG